MLFHYCSFATFNAVPQHVFVNQLEVLPTWSSMSSSPLCSCAWPFSGRYVLQKVPNMQRCSSKAYTERTRTTEVKKAFISLWNRHYVSKRGQQEFDCKRVQIMIFFSAVNRVSLETEQNEILTQEKTQVCMSKHAQSSVIEVQYSECTAAGRFLCHRWVLGLPIWCNFFFIKRKRVPLRWIMTAFGPLSHHPAFTGGAKWTHHRAVRVSHFICSALYMHCQCYTFSCFTSVVAYKLA